MGVRERRFKKKIRRKKTKRVTHPPEKSLRFLHFNPRGFSNKEEIIKDFLKKNKVSFAGLAETHSFRNPGFSDKVWDWQGGAEHRPNLGNHQSKGGIAVLVDRGLVFSLVKSGTFSLWTRIEIKGGFPIFVAECYFPNCSDSSAHKRAWAEIATCCSEFRNLGHLLIMGDFNTHIGLDKSKILPSGQTMLTHLLSLNLHLLNGTSTCTGSTTRSEERIDGTSTSTTIDYILVSDSLLPLVKSMCILDDRLGSDHHPILLKIRNLEPRARTKPRKQRVWRVENIPSRLNPPTHDLYLASFAAPFEHWIEITKTRMENFDPLITDATSIADEAELSFQTCLDEIATNQLGSKMVGPPSFPELTPKLVRLNSKRIEVEKTLRRTMSNHGSGRSNRLDAILKYRKAKAEALRGGAARKLTSDIQLFTEIEDTKGESKSFWNKARKIRSGIRNNVSPPPMVEFDDMGTTRCETDPKKALEIWKDFWEALANPNPTEDLLYDHDHKLRTLERLAILRNNPGHQPELDLPFSREEVWIAIRKLEMGKAAGVDGILPSIIKSAADAVDNSLLLEYNPLVDSLSLLFNFIFEHEVWPKRWGQGIIIPIFKEGSRLNPGNYRPIALLSVISKLFGSIVEKRLSDWSEQTLPLADEQGGFRRHRGTPELIFMLREIILERKARGQPTLTTFIDARKAYDSVWREGNFVHIFDLGITGKLWRQLQAMSANSVSKIRLPFGDTPWYRVSRGVAQGAVESPFLYSCFINGLAEKLKSKGLGIVVADILTPLLMYADDVVLLAASVKELHLMNEVASQYAFANRYQFNGKKSNVMCFYGKKNITDQVRLEPWELLRESVSVSKSYNYLGIFLNNNLKDWNSHILRTISKAISSSEELAWLCRQDSGLLPRSATTLWKAIVRPILEYASEIWSGDISKELTRKVESVQTHFLRAILGLQGCQSIPNDFIRAETGMEKLSSRWEKRRLGFWRRLLTSTPGTTLNSLVLLRHQQVDNAALLFNNGWMGKIKKLLLDNDLDSAWNDPSSCTETSKGGWNSSVAEAIETSETTATMNRLANLSSDSAARFLRSKDWGKLRKEFATSKSEAGRRGALVCERYLDDRKEPVGRRLKLMCRAGCLPLLKRIAREEKLPVIAGICKMCNTGYVEDLDHFILECEAYSKPRTKLSALTSLDPLCLKPEDRLDFLLGRSTGSVDTDTLIDLTFKRFLKKAWRIRIWLVKEINSTFKRLDTPWALQAHGDNTSLQYDRTTKFAPKRSSKTKSCLLSKKQFTIGRSFSSGFLEGSNGPNDHSKE